MLRPGGRAIIADFGEPAHWFARIQFLPVRLFDGWQRTRCHVAGEIPKLIRDGDFDEMVETLSLSTLLGTLRCYVADRSD